MAPTLRDAIRGHIAAPFSALKCSFPTVLWEPYLCIMKKALSLKKMVSEKDFARFIRETGETWCVLGQESSSQGIKYPKKKGT